MNDKLLRALALYHAAKRVGATADLVFTMSLLDRRLCASIAGVDDANDEDWTTVRKLFLTAEGRSS